MEPISNKDLVIILSFQHRVETLKEPKLSRC